MLAFACFVAPGRPDLNFDRAVLRCCMRALDRGVFNGSVGRSPGLTRTDLRTTLNSFNLIAPRAPQSANFREVSCPANHARYSRQPCSALGFLHSARNCPMDRARNWLRPIAIAATRY